VKLSWLIWRNDGMIIDIGETLRDLENRLKGALEMYRGQFRQPALQLLAYVHEILGKLAVERTATAEALLHFQEMYDIAEELSDPELFTLALIHQSEMFRRRKRYEASFRRIEAAEKHAQRHVKEISKHIQGVMWKAYARNYYVYGDEQGFLRMIERATTIAEDVEATVDTLSSEFDKVEVLQVRAQGYTALWKPEKALEIYKETDRLRSFRPLRYQGPSLLLRRKYKRGSRACNARVADGRGFTLYSLCDTSTANV
jgi:tetratricopeptide (TPR) repeat protein